MDDITINAFAIGKPDAVNSIGSFDEIRNALQDSQASGKDTYVSAALGSWLQGELKKRAPAELDAEFPCFRVDLNDIRRIYGIGAFDPTIPSLRERNQAAKQDAPRKGMLGKLVGFFENGLVPKHM